ncbi:hypothetical protein NP233_g11126 [Leucocoprinus birnbaumii]|uniref:F-box domain-containing protein n=1 Tax=Leucocoprinus birnbaumii TaxID=56174 RepID=A0AAD5YR86_9AGAR|nr:hypothetical protein NP233_g11126 [Leucocoprinus birnbaumii]
MHEKVNALNWQMEAADKKHRVQGLPIGAKLTLLCKPPMSLFSLWGIYSWLTSPNDNQHTCPRIFQSQVPVFLSLPNELLVDILAWSDCASIFSARMTCSKLCKITKSRHLWLKVISRLQQERGLVGPEGGVSRYDVKELESWTQRRFAAAAALEFETEPRPSVRRIKLRTDDLGDFCIPQPYLLPGGRWFLVAHQSSRMLAYDLDCANPIRRTLFNPVDFDKTLASEYVRQTLWFDHSRPLNPLYVAANAFTRKRTRTIIYTIELEGHGTNAKLSASFVSAFHSHGRKDCREDQRNQEIHAYDFQQACGSKGYRSIKPAALAGFTGEPIHIASFVYDDVLLICTEKDAIRLYDIVDSEATSNGHFPSSFHLLHTVTSPCHFSSTCPVVSSRVLHYLSESQWRVQRSAYPA